MPKMNADDIARTNFQPGDLVRWIGEWPFPLVDAPPRENTVLAIENDGRVHLEGRHGGEGPQRWWCPPDQLIYRESVQVAALEVDPSPQGAGAAQDAIKADTLKVEHGEANSKIAERLRRIMSTCFDGSRSGDLAFQLADMEEWIPKFTSEWKANHRRWLDLCDRLGFDALDLEQRGRVAEVDAVAGEASEIKRIRNIVDEDARKRHGNREGEPSWGVIADCVLAHVSQHRQARKSLDVPEQVTLDQYVAETSQYLRVFETSLVNAGKWDPYPELPLNLLAREIVAQAERWRIDAEHYRGEASNATATMVESLSVEVARLTGEVAATRAEAVRQIGARDAELAALVTRVDLISEANECTAHNRDRVPRVFSAASSVEALHLRLEEADRHLAGLQDELRQRADEGGRARKFGVECTTEADAIADAWIDCKASNDPPGMQVAGPAGNTTLWSWRLLSGAHEAVLWSRSEAEARAAAWAWYDRRLALHERLRCGLGDRLGRCDGLDFWPLILSWSDDQVAEVERWLVDSTAEMPEVLRG